MCEYPWSNRDQFALYDDCHIYQPMFIFLNILPLIPSIIALVYGIYIARRVARKNLAIIAALVGLFFTLSQLIILGGGISFGDRNLGLNLVHGIASGLVWIHVSYYSFRNIEVIIAVDHFTKNHSLTLDSLPLITKTKNVILAFDLVVDILAYLIPTFIPSVSLLNMVGSVSAILMFLNMFPHMMYARELTKIVRSAPTAGGKSDFYDELRKKLEFRTYSDLIATIIGGTVVICWMVVPVFTRNMYCIYPVQMLAGPTSAIIGTQHTSHSADRGQKKSKSGSGAGVRSRTQTHTTPEQNAVLGEQGQPAATEPHSSTPGKPEDLEAQLPLTVPDSPVEERALMDPLATSSGGHFSPSSSEEALKIFNPFTENAAKSVEVGSFSSR